MTDRPSPPPAPPFDGVVYQIYPRSFLDTTGNGVGDLRGITARLDHLVWLGVDALWLSPIYRSPMVDFGYDVADHRAVDPLFGTIEDVDELLAEAHRRGLAVWLDWVPNHTSDQHPWFLASRSSRSDAKRDWYVWRDPSPDGGPPNNWTRHFADEPAWTFDELTGQYYLHLFTPQQPDLNWANPQVQGAMHDVLRFWLDRGVDGFRADVIHLIGKDPSLPDDPPERLGTPRAGFHHHPDITHELVRGIRRVLDAYPSRPMVGEINLSDAAEVATYVAPDRLHLGFVFGLVEASWDPAAWREAIERVEASFGAVDAWPAFAIGNHDQSRVATRVGGEARARAAALVLLTVRGVPFVYAGDELGQRDALVPPQRVVDPGGRDGCRAPVPWTARASDGGGGHGWAGEPWLPWPPEPESHNLEVLVDDPGSVLHLYRRLLALRRAVPSLHAGAQRSVPLGPDVLAYRRFAPDGDPGGDRLVVLAMGGTDVEVALPSDVATWTVELASDGVGEGAAFGGVLSSDRALLLRPG